MPYVDDCDHDGDVCCPNCCDCEDSYDEDSYYDEDNDNLHPYDYQPYLHFNGEKPPWYGIEFEITTDNTSALVNVASEYAGNLVWCKSDSSVAGAELVTHPMSYDWAMVNFPWGMLQAIRLRADASIVPSDNGIHIHVSRDGFTNAAHLYRWMKFWYRNPSDIQRIARRRDTNWGAFRPDHRAAHKEHVKYGKPGYDRYNDNTRNSRYAAINTTNRETLEVRVFASTLRANRARAALGLVAGTVEYTRQLTANQVLHNGGWQWASFITWAASAGQYYDLVEENSLRTR